MHVVAEVKDDVLSKLVGFRIQERHHRSSRLTLLDLVGRDCQTNLLSGRRTFGLYASRLIQQLWNKQTVPRAPCVERTPVDVESVTARFE